MQLKIYNKEQIINIGKITKNNIINADCLEVMYLIEDNSVDMILADLPYGTTSCAWDSHIPLQPLWKEYKRVLKKYGTVVLTGSQPFTTELIYSNKEWYKYSWVWKKNRATGHVHAKNKPMKIHEDVCIFSEGNTLHKGQSEKRMDYHPQGLIELPPNTKRRTRNDSGDNSTMGKRKSHKETYTTHTNYPNSILEFPIEMNSDRIHETQKPVALFEYMINTYSKEGDIILDNCSGSGTTAIASINANRNYIIIEKDKIGFDKSTKRILDYIKLRF